MIKGVTCLARKLEGLPLRSAWGPRSRRNLHVRTKQIQIKTKQNPKELQRTPNWNRQKGSMGREEVQRTGRERSDGSEGGPKNWSRARELSAEKGDDRGLLRLL